MDNVNSERSEGPLSPTDLTNKGGYTQQGARIESSSSTKPIMGLAAAILLILMTFISWWILSEQIVPPNSLDLRREISTIVKNGGTLDDVQHIYGQESLRQSVVDLLRDVRIDELKSDIPNEDLLSQIDNLIIESEELNPFGALEENQQYLFETLRSKSGTDYNNIEDDLNRIVEELRAKNIAVNKYLGDATWSLRLSMLALMLTIVQILYSLLKEFRLPWLSGLSSRIRKWSREDTDSKE